MQKCYIPFCGTVCTAAPLHEQRPAEAVVFPAGDAQPAGVSPPRLLMASVMHKISELTWQNCMSLTSASLLHSVRCCV